MRSLQEISGAPASGISQGSTCICLPARSPALRDGGRGISDQPEKNEFFNRLRHTDIMPKILNLMLWNYPQYWATRWETKSTIDWVAPENSLAVATRAGWVLNSSTL